MKQFRYYSTARVLLTLGCVFGLLIGVAACDNEDEIVGELPTDRNLRQTVEAEPTLDRLEEAATAAGLLDALGGGGPVTLFAVPNNAFEAIEFDSLLEDDETLASVVQYHVVNSAVTAEDLNDGATFQTAGGQTLTVRDIDGTTTINGAEVLRSREQANGYIHVLDRLLFPDLVTQAQYTSNLSGLVEALTTAGLVGNVQGQEVTVFAPANAAFEALSYYVDGEEGGGFDDLLADTTLLTKLLTYHAVPGKVLSSGIEDGATLETLQGDEVQFSVEGGTVMVNGATVTSANYETANGVIHIIDDVLFESATAFERAQYTVPTFMLVEAVEAAGLDETLNSEGPFTVFAPVSAAFEEVNMDTLLNAPDLLDEVLEYHVVSGQVIAGADIADGQTVQTVEGGTLTFNVDAEGIVTVNGVPVSTTDIRVSNGVIHLIDGVLLETLSLSERAVVTPETSTLADAVAASGLAGTLNTGGPYTLFAPSNTAFDALDIDVLLGDQELLQRVLQGHLIEGRVAAGDITDGMTVTTLAGTELNFTIDEEGEVLVNGLRVSTADLETENGVIHLINQALLGTTTLAEQIRLRTDFSTLNEAVAEANLTATLNSDGPFTVFAPTEEAVGIDTLAALVDSMDSDALNEILTYHVVSGAITAADISDGQTVTTMEGSELRFLVDEDGIVSVLTLGEDGEPVDTAQVTTADFMASNGVIHAINSVLLPPSDEGIGIGIGKR